MGVSARETFLERWTRRKAEHVAGAAASSPTLPVARDAVPEALPRPTLADVAELMPDADYSGFITAGIDRAVHRAAMKKLFAEPHFNVMDGLDIYISDYTAASPVSPAMLAGLAHVKSTLDPKPAWPVEERNDELAVHAEAQVVSEFSATDAVPRLNEADKDAQMPVSGEGAPTDLGNDTPPQVLVRADVEEGLRA